MTTPRIEEIFGPKCDTYEENCPTCDTYEENCPTCEVYKAIDEAYQAGLKSTRRLKSELAKYKKAHKTQQKTISKLQEERLKAHQAGIDEAVRVVREQMDLTEFETNAEFIACDDLAIRIIKALQNNK